MISIEDNMMGTFIQNLWKLWETIFWEICLIILQYMGYNGISWEKIWKILGYHGKIPHVYNSNEEYILRSGDFSYDVNSHGKYIVSNGGG